MHPTPTVSITELQPQPRADRVYLRIGKSIRHDGSISDYPNEAYRRMERLYGGPYLELFARKPRESWKTWGNEVPSPHPLDIPSCLRGTPA
jgi:N6-adenosine-specific RNA methylase IME4